MWRYQELLPLDGEPTVGRQVGGTPLVRADRLAEALGVEKLWLKNDAVNFPTLSFKDRVVAVALSKAREFGFTTVGCASTGNLANSVAANAAAAGLDSYIFVPADLERAKILGTSVYGAKVIGVNGTYDEVNRLCTQVAFKYGWGFVNINLRPFYAEGSKTFGFEIAEQLGWRTPQHVVCPMAGGSLIGKIHKAFNELHKVGLIDEPACKFYGAQATGCNPISTAVKNGWETHRPVRKPNTIAKSLAIGDPADGYFAAKVIRESGGWAEDVSDAEIAEAMALLARTEGIFAETAGGVTVAVTRKLIEQGRIPPRRGDRALHHRQRPQDAGRRRRPAGAAGGDRAVAGGVRFRWSKAPANRCWCKIHHRLSTRRDESAGLTLFRCALLCLMWRIVYDRRLSWPSRFRFPRPMRQHTDGKTDGRGAGGTVQGGARRPRRQVSRPSPSASSENGKVRRSSTSTSTTRTSATSTTSPRRSRTATSWRSSPPWPEADMSDDDEPSRRRGARRAPPSFPLIPPELGVDPLLLAVLHATVFLAGSDEEVVDPRRRRRGGGVHGRRICSGSTAPSCAQVREDMACLVALRPAAEMAQTADRSS